RRAPRAARARVRVPRRLRHRADGVGRRRIRRTARRRGRRADRGGPAGGPAGARVKAASVPQERGPAGDRAGGAGGLLMLLLFDGIDEPGLSTLPVYERRGGYQQLRNAVAMTPEEVLGQISASSLRGRGGAGFRMGQKAGFLPHGEMEKYLVCNADESEPGTFKDRELMQKNPHMLIEGILIASWAAE